MKDKKQIANILAIEMEKYIRPEPKIDIRSDFDSGWDNAVWSMIDVVGEVLLGVEEYAYERTCDLHKTDVLPNESN